MKLSGTYLTNMTVSFCPEFDNTFTQKKGFTLSDLKPKHVLWSILGVATVVGIGMICGLLVNAAKSVYNKKIRTQPIHYMNIKEPSFA